MSRNAFALILYCWSGSRVTTLETTAQSSLSAPWTVKSMRLARSGFTTVNGICTSLVAEKFTRLLLTTNYKITFRLQTLQVSLKTCTISRACHDIDYELLLKEELCRRKSRSMSKIK